MRDGPAARASTFKRAHKNEARVILPHLCFAHVCKEIFLAQDVLNTTRMLSADLAPIACHIPGSFS